MIVKLTVVKETLAPTATNDLNITKEKAPDNILKNDHPPNFQLPVANGHLEKQLTTAAPKFEIGENLFAEHFVVIKKLTGRIIGSQFMKNNSVVVDTTRGLIYFPHLTMQVKTASRETTTKPQLVGFEDVLTIPLKTTQTITAYVSHLSEWNTKGTVAPLENFAETARLLISHSMSTKIDNRIAFRSTNTLESPKLIKMNTQIE